MDSTYAELTVICEHRYKIFFHKHSYINLL